MRTTRIILTAWLLAILCAATAEAQMTRSQLMKKFYRATTLSENGKDSLALEELDEVVQVYPRLPITYLRMAQVYDAMAARHEATAKIGATEAERKASTQKALETKNAAVLMYRRFLSLELDDKKTAEASARLRRLENELQISHFEDDDEKQSQQEMAQKTPSTIPTVTSDKEAVRVAAAVEEPTPIAGFTPEAPQPTAPALAQQTPTPAAPVAPTAPAVTPVEEPSAIEEPTPIAAVTPQPAPSQPVAPAATMATTVSREPEALQCSTMPEFANTGLSRLQFYEIQLPPQAVTPAKAEIAMTPEALAGHWVSSEANSDGREYWIFDIAPFGTNCSVTLNGEAGVLNKPVGTHSFYNSVVSFLKRNEVLGNTTLDIPCDQVEGIISGGRMSFMLESEKTYKPSTSIYTWGHTLFDNLSALVPVGGILFKMGDNFIRKREEKDTEKTYMQEARFNFSLVDHGVMRCDYSLKEKMLTTKGAKLIRNEMKSFYFYRTPANYSYFKPLDLQMDDDDECQSLFLQVQQDASRDVSFNYPLAELLRYGVGTDGSDAKAFAVMTELATKKECGRAMAWLATQYFNAACDNTTDISRSTRKKYVTSSNYWLQKMREKGINAWYALKGDMCLSNNEPDSAIYYYKQGAMKGEPYANYKLGTCALTGEGMRQDMQQARHFLGQAAQKNYADAYLSLAKLDRMGVGGQPDMNSYLANLSKAIDLGSADAFKELSDAYRQGFGVERNFEKASIMREYWYRAQQCAWLDVLALYGYDIDRFK